MTKIRWTPTAVVFLILGLTVTSAGLIRTAVAQWRASTAASASTGTRIRQLPTRPSAAEAVGGPVRRMDFLTGPEVAPSSALVDGVRSGVLVGEADDASAAPLIEEPSDAYDDRATP